MRKQMTAMALGACAAAIIAAACGSGDEETSTEAQSDRAGIPTAQSDATADAQRDSNERGAEANPVESTPAAGRPLRISKNVSGSGSPQDTKTTKPPRPSV